MYELIHAERAHIPVALACRDLETRPSADLAVRTGRGLVDYRSGR
jgi:hypothetical protein